MISIIGYTDESELVEWGTIWPSKIIVTTIDRTAHPARGRVTRKFRFDGMTATATFILVKTPFKQFIVGYDFCRIFGIELSVNKHVRAQLSDRKSDIGAPFMGEAATIDVSDEAEWKDCVESDESHIMVVNMINVRQGDDLVEPAVGIEQTQDEVYYDSECDWFFDSRDDNTNEEDHGQDIYYDCSQGSDAEWSEGAGAEAPIDALLKILIASASTKLTKKQQRQLSKHARFVDATTSITTAQGADDTENDALPAKHACVSEPQDLTSQQRQLLDKVLAAFPYTPETGELNCTTEYVQEINTGDAKPQIRRQYPLSPYIQEEIAVEIKKLLARGIIVEIDYSPWRWPILWVRKKSGGGRICVDARGLNELTIPDAYPSLNVDAILRNLPQARYISSIDMTQAYHQIPIRKEDQVKTTFAVGSSLYCYKRAIMGFRNSAADLTKLLDRMFRDLHPQVYHYVDDFIVVSDTFEKHMELLEEVARRLKGANLSISSEKSQFCHKKLTFLGYVLSERGLEPNSERVKPILEYKRPETVRDVRRLIGLVNWYRRFIPDAAEILAPLSELTKGQTKNSKQRIKWTSETARALERVKEILASEPILAMADYNRPFKIYSDASLTAGSAILTQNFDGQERVIFYHSVKFTPTQQNYSATERELLSVLAGVEKFRPWIDGSKFEVVTDHASLKWLQNLKEPHGKLARWAVRLQAFDIKFTHRPGKDMELPDALSRAVALIDLQNTEASRDRWYLSTSKRARSEPMLHYKYENGQLYRRNRVNSHAGDRLWRLCIPEELRKNALEEKHDQASHPGVWKTQRLVQYSYYWPNLQQDVYEHVTKCTICRQCKSSNEGTHALVGTYRDPGRVGRMISIDLIGPLPPSKIHGHQHAVVAIDCFSKYVFSKTFVRATALQIAKFVEEDIIYKFETPEVIVCDNGAQFISKTFEDLLKKYHIRKMSTPLYFPQANPVEATNKTIKTALRTEILAKQGNHQDWAACMPFITMRLNVTPHTATEQSPHYIVYGHEKAETGDEHRILMDATPDRTDERDRRELIYDEAAEAQRAQFEQNAKRYNLRGASRTFAPGDEVFVQNKKLSSAADKYTQKLAEKKIPARIKGVLGKDTYLVTDRNGKEIGNWHSSMIYTR